MTISDKDIRLLDRAIIAIVFQDGVYDDFALPHGEEPNGQDAQALRDLKERLVAESDDAGSAFPPPPTTNMTEPERDAWLLTNMGAGIRKARRQVATERYEDALATLEYMVQTYCPGSILRDTDVRGPLYVMGLNGTIYRAHCEDSTPEGCPECYKEWEAADEVRRLHHPSGVGSNPRWRP